MTTKSATPYLILRGAARQAIPFYEKALGAKVKSVQTFGEMDDACPQAMRDLVMHAVLTLDHAELMLSDGPGPSPAPTDGGVSVALSLDDRAQVRRMFEALSVGGKVHTPLFDSPWGSLFGVVKDKFGIDWMLDAS